MTLSSNSLNMGTKCPACPLSGAEPLLAGATKASSRVEMPPRAVTPFCQRQDVSHGPQTPFRPSTRVQPLGPWSPTQWGFQKGSSSCLHSTEVHTGFTGFGARSPLEPHGWRGPGRPGFPGFGGESSRQPGTPSSPSVPVLTRQKVHQRAHATPALRPHRPRMRSESEEGGRHDPPTRPPPLSRGWEEERLESKTTPNAPFSCLLSIPQMW